MVIRKHVAVLVATVGLLSLSTGLEAQAPREGIGIHGHWVIEVRNPGGTLAARREFDNDVRNGAETIVTSTLSRTQTVGLWIIALFGTPGPFASGRTLCDLDFLCTNVDGLIVEESVEPSLTQGLGMFRTLVVEPARWYSTTQSPNPLVLRGSAIALQDGDIDGVYTDAVLCRVAEPCPVGRSELDFRIPFTGTRIPPLHLDKDQRVEVTVSISFK